MNRNKKTPGIAARVAISAFAFAVMSANSATYELYNQYADADFLTPGTWKIGSTQADSLPSSGDAVYITSKGDIGICLSNSVSVDYGNIRFCAYENPSSLRFYASDGCSLTMPASPGGNYNATAFYLLAADSSSLLTVKPSASTDAILSFRNPDFTLSRGSGGYISTFTAGDYNFYDPDGGTAYSGNEVSFLAGTHNFCADTSLRIPKLKTSSSAKVNILGACEIFGETTLDGSSRVFFSSGATASIKGSLTVKGTSSMLVTNGTTLVMANDANVGGSSSAAIIVSNSTYSSSGRNLDIGGSTDGLFRLAGGSMTVSGGEGVRVGNSGGSGTLELVDGTMTVSRIRLSRAGATAGKSCVFHQKGGIFSVTADNGIEFQQSCTGNNTGTHYVKLDGGVCTLAKIHRASTVTAGNAILSADGGTLKPRANNTSFILNLTRCEFGSKGLTLDTNGKNVTLNSPVANKSGESGLFVKSGTGTATFNGNSWSVLRTVVTGGKLLFASDLDADTDLVVVNDGVFSLSGAATSVAVDSLAVTNAAIELDPGDTITVSGPIGLSRARISWTTLPESEQPFLIVDHELSATEELALRKIHYSNALADGTHSEMSFSYDEETGKTTVKTKVVADARLTDSALWSGSGAWADASNWSGSVKPTATTVATFGAVGAGTAVVIADGDSAGALAFTNASYTLSGESPLLLSGEAGSAAIDVTAGDHEIANPVEAYATIKTTVSAGSSLKLGGGVSGDGIVKTGTGRMTIGGRSDIASSISSSDGFLTVIGSDALGDSGAAVSLWAGTMEFPAQEGFSPVIPSHVSVDGAAATTTVVFKTDCDVTLSNFTVTAGRWLKRGAGTLTIDIPSNTTRSIAATFSGWGITAKNNSYDTSFPADGSQPNDIYAALNVAEGELRFVGHGESVAMANGPVLVGVQTTSGTGAQALTLDHVTMDCSSTSFFNGWRNGTAKKNTHTLVRAVNGATLSLSATMPGYTCTSSDTSATYAFTNSTYRYSDASNGYITRSAAEYVSKPIVRYLFNASKLYTPSSAKVDGSMTVDLDMGSVFSTSGGNVVTIASTTTENRLSGEILVRGGSTLKLGGIEQNASQDKNLVLVFDDGVWVYDNVGGGDKTWPVPTYGCIVYEMRGRGAVLSPSAGCTFTTQAPFTGTGGIVNAGKGTVAFASGTAQFGGIVEVADADGAVDFSANGATLSGNGLKGSGKIIGASISGATFPVDLSGESAGGALTLHNCTLTGRVLVDAGRTAENPLVPGLFAEPVAIAKISGTTVFNPSQWRLVNTGVKNLGGEFRLVGDTVYLQALVSTGMIIMVF